MNIITKALYGIKKAFDLTSDSFVTFTELIASKLTKGKLLKQYKNLVFSCITAIATDVAKYEPLFYRKDAKGNKTYIDHPFKKLLEQPNPDQTQYDLFESLQSYLELTGDNYWYLAVGEVSRLPKMIYTMRPDLVKIAKDDNGKTIGYVYEKSSEVKIPLELDEVIHFKTFNPFDPDHGMGTVEAGLLYIDTENSTSEFQKNFMDNQASPSGVLSLSGNIKKETFNKIKKQWKEANSGVKNVGKTLIIRNTDATFQKVGLSIADIDMEKLKGITDSRVRGMFKVPKPLLGETDSSGLGRANVEAVEYIFAKRVIDPKQVKIDDAIRLAVRRIYKDNSIYVDHVSQVPEDDEKKLNYQSTAVNKWITINEARAMEGLDPVDGGDKLYVSFNDIPIDEPLTPGNEQNTKIVVRMKDTEEKKHVCDEHCGHVHNSVDKKKVAKTTNAEASYMNALERLEVRTNSPYRKILTPYLDDQEKRVIAVLNKTNNEKSILKTLNSLESKVEKSEYIKKVADDLIDEVTHDNGTIEVIIEKLVALLFGVYQKSGVKGVEFLGKPDADFLAEQAQRDYIFESTARQLKSFDEQTAIKIQQQIAQGLEAGDDLDALQKRIESVYEDATGFRARRIAQTEAHKAINYGSAMSYSQNGVMKMKWVAFETACDYCKEMSGTIVEIGTAFIPKGASVSLEDGSEFLADYEDVSYADLHPWCNCKLLPVT